ncbi:regulatory protein RecX [Aliikangiella sp. IMCC44359]|uniref:regulatory protein RecX n=1 Tax=Aliikangiella sp. IMCC44359 TaxID=3459125 RepID=UPI00403AA7C6
MIEQPVDASLKKRRINKGISYACRLLGVREYSEKLIQDKLISKNYSPQEAQQIISFLLENNWLSNNRFCESYLRSKSEKGIGAARIRFELRQKGIPDEMVSQALEAADICWQTICNQATKKKVSTLLINDIKAQQKLERFLRYRGFSGTEIRESIEKYFVMGVSTSEYDE